MDQQVMNVIITIAGAFGGWWMKAIWESVKELQRTDRALTTEVTELKVLVAGQYMKRDEFERTSQAIFAKLDRIEDKLDHKADKV